MLGEYVSGWIKRGPSGVIGTNKKDSQDTVDKILEDATAGRLNQPPEDDIEALIANNCADVVNWDGWRRSTRSRPRSARARARHDRG